MFDFIKKLFKKEPKNKPWIKSTGGGRLYIDTLNPEWQKWFREYIMEQTNKWEIKDGILVRKK